LACSNLCRPIIIRAGHERYTSISIFWPKDKSSKIIIMPICKEPRGLEIVARLVIKTCSR
jgi:hypothetical protein